MKPEPQPHLVHQPLHPHPLRTRLRNLLLGGLLILAPAYLTIYVLLLLFRFMDGIFAPLIDKTLATFLEEPGIHIPGLGILLTLLVILFLGWLSTRVLGRQMIDGVEAFIRRIPVVRSVYGATKGVLEAVSRDQADAFKRVVLVEYPRRGMYGIAFVTGGPSRWGPAPHDEELVSVFVPTTPNPTSGYLLLVPERDLIEVPMTIEEGVRMVVSGGILPPPMIVAQAQSQTERDTTAELVGREF
ncbi:MAG TPA: DUF502 domain-containing protein [Thermoanaerobaculia bacterium]|nr:DUF502 domain-containing protein [Thermoanaerobaculia bacterium]